jgi:hypothetical protein
MLILSQQKDEVLILSHQIFSSPLVLLLDNRSIATLLQIWKTQYH